MKKINFDLNDSGKIKIIAAVGYLGILFLVPFFFGQKSKFALHHAKQGLVLFIAEVVVSFVNIIPVLGQLIWFLAVIFFIVVSFIGVLKALRGKYYEAPIIGKYAKKIEI